jgi:hypothetical protein
MISAILALCLLFSGCGIKEAEAETTPNTATEAETETTLDTTTEAETETTLDTTAETESDTLQQTDSEYEVPLSAAENAKIDYYAAYQSVFQDYETIFDSGWNAEDYLNNDFPLQLIYCMGDTPYDNIGYLLMDLDNDGIQELLIGEASADPYYDCLLLQMYTLENGDVVKVLSSEENASYQLCEDSTIALTCVDGADDAGVSHYAYSAGTLQEVTSSSPAQAPGYTSFSFYEQYMK